MSKVKNLSINTTAILMCISIVFISAFFIKVSSTAQVQFTADTIISLSGINGSNGLLFLISLKTKFVL